MPGTFEYTAVASGAEFERHPRGEGIDERGPGRRWRLGLPGRGRKVRTPQGRPLRKSQRGRPRESATENRPPMASSSELEQARVKRRCKRPPAARATESARQTLAGARPSKKAIEDCPSEPSGGPQRWMSPHDRIRLTGPLSERCAHASGPIRSGRALGRYTAVRFARSSLSSDSLPTSIGRLDERGHEGA